MIEAHGGLERFNNIQSIALTVNVSGMLWKRKAGLGHRQATMIVEPWLPKATFIDLLGNGDKSTKWVWTPQAVWKEGSDGAIIEKRETPREAFKGHEVPTPWDHLHLLYFSGYAITNYMCTPFYFTWPGFEAREVDNQLEDSIHRKWRVLEVTYPEGFDAHCKVQKYYFDQNHLLRRLDYHADVVGSTSTAHMCYDHQNANGLVVPMLRRALRPEGLEAGGPSAVLLDIQDVQVKDKESAMKHNL